MDKTCKCASCMHCEMCRWVDEVEQNGCHFYAASSGDVVSREAVINYICERKECYKENCKGKTHRRCPDIMWVYDLPSAQITFKEVEDYCRPRMLKVIAAELFEEVKSRGNNVRIAPETEAKKYRKNPVEIEALQINKNPAEITAFVGEDCEIHNYMLEGEHCVEICTLEGVMQASEGDYIIKGVKGEFYPCRKDIFEETYEEIK